MTASKLSVQVEAIRALFGLLPSIRLGLRPSMALLLRFELNSNLFDPLHHSTRLERVAHKSPKCKPPSGLTCVLALGPFCRACLRASFRSRDESAEQNRLGHNDLKRLRAEFSAVS